MATQSGRSFRGRPTDSQRDEMLIRMVDQLDSLHIQLSNFETRISQPTNESSHVEQGETSQANNQENKEEKEAIQAPQYPMSEWARGLLERRHKACDTVGDITKKVKMEVPDFEGKVDATQFLDWLAAIEEYFDWYDIRYQMFQVSTTWPHDIQSSKEELAYWAGT